jgi:hypothetical protein
VRDYIEQQEYDPVISDLLEEFGANELARLMATGALMPEEPPVFRSPETYEGPQT